MTTEQDPPPRDPVRIFAELLHDMFAFFGMISIVVVTCASQCCIQTYDKETGEVRILGRCSEKSQPLKDTCRHLVDGAPTKVEQMAEEDVDDETPNEGLYMNAELNDGGDTE